MARSRNDSTGSNNVDHYRKQIGKQDYKKSKVNLKETKHLSEKKENALTQYKDVSILVATILALCLCVYCILYAMIAQSSK